MLASGHGGQRLSEVRSEQCEISRINKWLKEFTITKEDCTHPSTNRNTLVIRINL